MNQIETAKRMTQKKPHPVTGIEHRGLYLESIDELKEMAKFVRRDIMTLLAEAGSASSLTCPRSIIC